MDEIVGSSKKRGLVLCKRTVLRNVAVKKGDVWVATCLELGIVVTSPRRENIRDTMAKAVELYAEGLDQALEEGRQVRIVPVKHYWPKRLRFELLRFLDSLGKLKRPTNMLWQKERSFAC